VPSPPPHHNFDVIPEVVRGPHELSNPEVMRALNRDWIAQNETLPPPATRATGVLETGGAAS
jgi:cytochrome c oxidase subunit 1